MRGNGEGDGVQSVERALAILVLLGQSTDPVGVTSLGQMLGLPKSTVHRLLSTLQQSGFVDRHAGGRYGVSPLALRVAGLAAAAPSTPRIPGRAARA
jgi:DNA-binding IclR family transcriptional regulator